ncbi:MAG: hypothetical protein AB9M53_03820 [Leptothrix sp. (in: b-proteobacteria)]
MRREDSTNLTNPTVELIKAYRREPRDIAHDTYETRTPASWAEECAEKGGFNPFTGEFTPLKFATAEMWMHEALDHITAAAEAGVVDRNGWSTQLFDNEDELEAFFAELLEYDQCYRITDRWWSTIAALVDSSDEEGLITGEEIVSALRESIEDGAERREVLQQEATYFAKNPLRPLRISAEKREALSDHNMKVRHQARTKGADEDVTLKFRFTLPYLELNKGRVSARQATAADVDAVMAKAAKRKS